MRQFYTAVLERLKDFTQSFATEPFEVAWATEAIFFVNVHQMAQVGGSVISHVQISADGINWIDEGTEIIWPASGTAFARVTHFGGWLRLRTTLPENADVRATLQLALKA